FATFVGRLNAAKTTVIRTSQRSIERGVGLPGEAAEAVPVVRSVFFHWQEVPGQARHLMIQIFNQWSRIGFVDLAAIPKAQTSNCRVVASAGFERLQKLQHRIGPFSGTDEVSSILLQRSFRQSRHVAADQKYFAVWRSLFQCGANRAGGAHILSG